MTRLIRAELNRAQRLVISLHSRFDAELRGFLMNSLRNRADVDDFAQEVYLRFLRREERRQIHSDRAFLFTTAVNLLRDRSRRLTTRLERASVPVDELSLTGGSDGPFEQVLCEEAMRQALSALDDLSKDCRRAFWLSRIEGQSYAEIAIKLSVSVSMVEKHISAALKRIRGALAG